MNREQRNKYGRGRRLVEEFSELVDRYQKLRFYLDTEEDVDLEAELALEAQSTAMKNYMDVLTIRLENSLY